MPRIGLTLVEEALFSNSKGLKRQLDYILLMPDEDGNTDVIQYGLHRSRHVTRSFMAFEIDSMVLGHDFAFIIQNVLEEILGREVLLQYIVDSPIVFILNYMDGRTAERRLQIQICALQQSYANG